MEFNSYSHSSAPYYGNYPPLFFGVITKHENKKNTTIRNQVYGKYYAPSGNIANSLKRIKN